jgi:ABC-type multidrug transport system fused ATPase/permease subunit
MVAGGFARAQWPEPSGSQGWGGLGVSEGSSGCASNVPAMRWLFRARPRPLLSYDERDIAEIMNDLRELDESLSTRTFGILGIAVGVAASLGAAASSGRVSYLLFVAAVLLLAFGVLAAAASMIRGRTAVRWEVESRTYESFANQEATRTFERAAAVRVAVWALIVASVLTTCAAIQALHFKSDHSPVTCQTTVPTHAQAKTISALVECFAG